MEERGELPCTWMGEVEEPGSEERPCPQVLVSALAAERHSARVRILDSKVDDAAAAGVHRRKNDDGVGQRIEPVLDARVEALIGKERTSRYHVPGLLLVEATSALGQLCQLPP